MRVFAHDCRYGDFRRGSVAYICGDDGILQNAVWLDYRMPLASDLPMIGTVLVEVPNPNHPFGVKGVAEAGM